MTKVALSVDVPDVSAAVDFFSRGLGFKKLRNEPPNAMVMDAGGLELWLLLKAEGSVAVRDTDISRSYRRHWTPIHLDVLVDDLNEALDRAVTAGATQEGDIVYQDNVSFCFEHQVITANTQPDIINKILDHL